MKMTTERENMAFETSYRARMNSAFFLLLLFHLPAICILAGFLGSSVLLPASVGAVLLAGPALVLFQQRDSELGSILLGIAAMGFSALLIHETGGRIEAHFHVFVMLAMMIVFGRMAPLVVAAAVIAVQHLAFWIWLPASIFNYQASFEVVLIHAFFVAFETAPACWIAAQSGRAVKATSIVEGKLEETAARLAQSAARVHASSEDLARQASGQAATLQDTAASTQELRTLAAENANLSKDAIGFIAAIDVQIGDANQRLSNVRTDVKEMSESTQRAGSIIKLIEEIAFQTNILALNASVEASRAGEMGLGFAVVADEVRSLSKKSTEAAVESKKMIDLTLDRASASQKSVAGLVAVMASVNEVSGNAKRELVTIQASARRQDQATAAINQSLSDLNRASQQTAAASAKGVASGDELSAQARDLGLVVSTLKQFS
jgi:hypothetical protein